MKYGFDVHGVIDTYPTVFAAMMRALVAAGHEVHVITGPSQTPEFEKDLEAHGVVYTHFCSIIDYCHAKGIAVTYDGRGNGWVRAEAWDSAKGEYCALNGIHLHIDDSDEYHKWFQTPYLKMMKRGTK